MALLICISCDAVKGKIHFWVASLLHQVMHICSSKHLIASDMMQKKKK
jgi:hypothetical protein